MGILVLVVIVIAIAAIAFSKGKKRDEAEQTIAPKEPVEISSEIMSSVKQQEKQPEKNSMEDQEKVSEDKKEVVAKQEVYYWLNGLTRQMFYHYRNEIWDEMTAVDPLENAEKLSMEEVKAQLGNTEAALLEEIISCVSPLHGKVQDTDKLLEIFYDMVLPFYPMYYYVFGNDIRYTAFLNKKTLGLFHQLSGKKFRVGYRNRYATGVTGFEWKGDRYKVFQKDGTLICDAVFKDHKLYNGYGTVEMNELTEEAWKVEKIGYWQDGSFTEGKIHYLYQKPCK